MASTGRSATAHLESVEPVSQQRNDDNLDPATVAGFGDEWSAFDQSQLTGREYDELFESYFGIFPFETLPPAAEGFDLGCGSGRWAARVAERVGLLHCVDPSAEALAVARDRIGHRPNVRLHKASAGSIPLADSSQDFGYSLGVLHHIPHTQPALRDCVKLLKSGAPFLLYLYYALDNRPLWFRTLWKATNAGRKVISRLPFALRRPTTDAIAVGIYWPTARIAALAELLGADVGNFPLCAYRRASLYTMRTDALDRFGTRLEHRFTRAEIEQMMIAAGLTDIRFSDRAPYWTAVGRRAG
jgi:SAM-dependent methyltransferase